MANRSRVSVADLANEFRLRHVRGSALDAIATGLAYLPHHCAELRKKHHESQRPAPELKRLAAGDID